MTGYTLAEVVGKKPNILKSGKMDPAVYDDLSAGGPGLMRRQAGGAPFLRSKSGAFLFRCSLPAARDIQPSRSISSKHGGGWPPPGHVQGRNGGHDVFHPPRLAWHGARPQHRNRRALRDLHQPALRRLAHLLRRLGFPQEAGVKFSSAVLPFSHCLSWVETISGHKLNCAPASLPEIALHHHRRTVLLIPAGQ